MIEKFFEKRKNRISIFRPMAFHIDYRRGPIGPQFIFNITELGTGKQKNRLPRVWGLSAICSELLGFIRAPLGGENISMMASTRIFLSLILRCDGRPWGRTGDQCADRNWFLLFKLRALSNRVHPYSNLNYHRPLPLRDLTTAANLLAPPPILRYRQHDFTWRLSEILTLQ